MYEAGSDVRVTTAGIDGYNSNFNTAQFKKQISDGVRVGGTKLVSTNALINNIDLIAESQSHANLMSSKELPLLGSIDQPDFTHKMSIDRSLKEAQA